MGWETKELEVCATVSRHNSEQDKLDDALFEELAYELECVVNHPKYRQIKAWMSNG